MKRRRSKLQKELLNLLERRKVRTQKEISYILNKNPSSINRAINLLMKENLVRKNDTGYFLTSKYNEEIKALDLSKITSNLAVSLGENLKKDWKGIYAYHSGIERMIRETNKSPLVRLIEEMDVVKRILAPSFFRIAEVTRIASEPFTKMNQEMKTSLTPLMKSNEVIGKKAFEPLFKSTSITEQISKSAVNTCDLFLNVSNRLNETFTLFDKNLQVSQLMLSKMSYLSSLNISNKFKINMEPLVGSVLNTTRYFQDYSLRNIQEILQRREFTRVDKNFYKFEDSSLIYKNLSYSIPYQKDKHSELKDFEIDFPIEAIKSRKLKKTFISIDPNLERMREGAWETLYSDNPDKCRQSAASMVELLDWALRLLAPDNEVKSHINIDKEDKITRSQRVEYILKPRSDSKIINFFCRNVKEINKFLNNSKHSLEYFDEKCLENLFYMIESIILFLEDYKS